MTVYEYDAQTLQGKQIPLSTFEGNVLLIVNTASKCGLTPNTKRYKSYMTSIMNRGSKFWDFPVTSLPNKSQVPVRRFPSFARSIMVSPFRCSPRQMSMAIKHTPYFAT